MQSGHVSVLIVDDEPAVRQFVSQVLESGGYGIRTAENAHQALSLVRDGGMPDVLLVDLKMPGMDGDELAAALRQAEPDLKILYFTGFSDQLFQHKRVLWENEAFLDKPCSIAGLQEAVAMLVYGRPGPRDSQTRNDIS
jgi:CheY-like chemotaxis protein